jgi:DNA-binding NtrC family response regulator
MRPDLVLLDIWMPDTDGVTLLKEWSTGGLLNMPVIMMSGHATIDTAVDAIRIGAQAFLEKPITLQKLLKTVEQGLAREQVRQAAAAYQAAQSAPGTSAVVQPSVAAGQDATAQVSQTFDLDLPLRDARDAFEKAYFEFHLSNEGGSMTRVADKTGLERTHLYRKLKQLGVDLTKGKRNLA